MTNNETWIRFADNLPSCCSPSSRLQLPRPTSVEVEAIGSLSGGLLWDLGLDEWCVRVRATWYEQENALAAAVRNHTRIEFQDFDQVAEVIAGHGVHLDEGMSAWVGAQDLVVVHIGSELNVASGRDAIWDGRDLFEAADAEAGDLSNLVAPLIAAEGDELWSQEIMETFPGAFHTNEVILLRSVNITPAMRGHHLGAWTAAQSIALFASGGSLIVTKAAPLERRDAVPGLEESRRLTAEESALWAAEQVRLVEQWRTQLGLVPLSSDPTILAWHTSSANVSIRKTLAHCAQA